MEPEAASCGGLGGGTGGTTRRQPGPLASRPLPSRPHACSHSSPRAACHRGASGTEVTSSASTRALCAGHVKRQLGGDGRSLSPGPSRPGDGTTSSRRAWCVCPEQLSGFSVAARGPRCAAPEGRCEEQVFRLPLPGLGFWRKSTPTSRRRSSPRGLSLAAPWPPALAGTALSRMRLVCANLGCHVHITVVTTASAALPGRPGRAAGALGARAAQVVQGRWQRAGARPAGWSLGVADRREGSVGPTWQLCAASSRRPGRGSRHRAAVGTGRRSRASLTFLPA